MLYMIAGGILVGLVCIDMGIKQYIEDTFKENEERETIIDKVVLRKVYNKGFCLNFLDRRTDIVKWCSVVSTIGVIFSGIRLFLQKRRWIHKLGMIVLAAGAISNTADRAMRGKVIDYIGVQSEQKTLGKITANLADAYIIIGAGITSIAKICDIFWGKCIHR